VLGNVSNESPQLSRRVRTTSPHCFSFALSIADRRVNGGAPRSSGVGGSDSARRRSVASNVASGLACKGPRAPGDPSRRPPPDRSRRQRPRRREPQQGIHGPSVDGVDGSLCRRADRSFRRRRRRGPQRRGGGTRAAELSAALFFSHRAALLSHAARGGAPGAVPAAVAGTERRLSR
jgi:hypothetical protein